jgi:UDP-glucuronate 4-epimerase
LAIHKFTALMEAGKPIPFFGDGSMGRDYTFVGDIVDGILASMVYQLPSQPAPFDVFNLGNSHPVKLAELIEYLEAATGRKAIIERRAVPSGDVPITWANLEKSSRLLGYLPKTPFQAGLKKFVDWYRSESLG